MRFTRYIGLSIILFSFITITKSQEKWSLEDCINYAIDNNISIKRQKLASESAHKTHFQSKMELLPNANANGTHYLNSGKVLNQDNYEYVNEAFQGGNLSISSNLVLFNGLKNYNNIQKTKYDLLSQLENAEKAKNDITINISTAYLQILLNKELKDISEQQLNVTLDQIEKTSTLVKIGNKAKGDLLQIEAQAAQEKVALTNAENNLNIAYLELKQLLNLEESASFEIDFPETPEISLLKLTGVDNIYNEAVEILPEIKSAEYQLKSSRKNYAIAKGSISPTLSVGYEYSSRYSELNRMQNGLELYTSVIGQTESGEDVLSPMQRTMYADNYPYMDQINDNASHTLYASIRIPIFNKWQTMTAISQAKINLLDSRLNLELQKQNLYKNIQQAQTQATGALERYKANMESVKYSEEAFNYTEQKYQVGLVDILEYKTAKNNLNKAKSDLSQSKYEYIFRIKILDFYKGEQITL